MYLQISADWNLFIIKSSYFTCRLTMTNRWLLLIIRTVGHRSRYWDLECKHSLIFLKTINHLQQCESRARKGSICVVWPFLFSIQLVIYLTWCMLLYVFKNKPTRPFMIFWVFCVALIIRWDIVIMLVKTDCFDTMLLFLETNVL